MHCSSVSKDPNLTCYNCHTPDYSWCPSGSQLGSCSSGYYASDTKPKECTKCSAVSGTCNVCTANTCTSEGYVDSCPTEQTGTPVKINSGSSTKTCYKDCKESCPDGYYEDKPNDTFFKYTTSGACYKVTGCKDGYYVGNTGGHQFVRVSGDTYHGTTCQTQKCATGYTQTSTTTGCSDTGYNGEFYCCIKNEIDIYMDVEVGYIQASRNTGYASVNNVSVSVDESKSSAGWAQFTAGTNACAEEIEIDVQFRRSDISGCPTLDQWGVLKVKAAYAYYQSGFSFSPMLTCDYGNIYGSPSPRSYTHTGTCKTGEGRPVTVNYIYSFN